MMKRILVATDFSTRSDRALRRATMLAREFEAHISLAHVVDDDQPTHLVRSQVDTAWPVLEATVRTVEAFDGVSADATVSTGDIASGIIGAGEEVGADLIVLGPHRRQLRDIFVGTTAERTVARTVRPMLMAASMPSAAYRRALVAFDLEDNAARIAGRIEDLGLLANCDLIAMHAFDAPARGMLQLALTDGRRIDEYVRSERQRVDREFGAFLAGIGLGPVRQRSLRLNGTVARTIRDCAEEEAADLIVLGASQRTGVERFLLGSVAEAMLGSADRDVLVIPGASELAAA
jgi:nucleotide-binding universal stress UspA family protein